MQRLTSLVAPTLRSRAQLSLRRSTRVVLRAGISTHTVPPLKDPSLLQPYPFIDNEFIIPTTPYQTFSVRDPVSGLKIADVPDQTVDDAKIAIKAAAAAFKSFRATAARERSNWLRRWNELVLENKGDLATLITWENGKPLADASGEVSYAASFLEWFAEEAPRIYGDTIPASVKGNRVLTQRQPVGVCGLITPWNFPAAMITRKVGPALAAGCTVVIKAPAETPLTSLALAELARRAGIPKGVINVVTTMENTPDVGKELCTNPVVKKISFTGSTAVGKLLMKQASGTLKKLSFELGGNAPFIVFDDADLDTAVAGAVISKFRSSGQTCVCANRIFVQEGIYDKFAEKLAMKVKEFRVGSGYQEGTTHGPLIHERAVEKVHGHVVNAREAGAEVVLGGKKMEHLGMNFYEPTVLTGMSKEMLLYKEETFGPVAALFPFKTEKEVVEMANDTEVGLAAYFFSKDYSRIWRVAEALEVGMVGINTGLISDPAAPFGGVKQSGFGREGSKYGVDEYTVVKMMTFGGIGDLQE
ncbi:aldehyde dehydrogenase domain-containing protein [Sphaerosporella brunnea]|uniref:Succinate-semialdehyde dehydrogenase n=1 Tax=Sphaerosporella brunnea TaxID=1250544 RepID=A0A5J5EPP5_9PEZI|nr:aldehyde dehydrogenase domain-containing protein [Sphaerosporella brunnea]